MLPTTIDAVKALLKADPTVTPVDRVRVVEAIRALGRDQGAAVVVPPRVMHRREMAERLGVSVRTVDNLAHQGIVRKIRLPGRSRACGFLATDIDRLLGQAEGAQ